jgi:thioredoxin 1
MCMKKKYLPVYIVVLFVAAFGAAVVLLRTDKPGEAEKVSNTAITSTLKETSPIISTQQPVAVATPSPVASPAPTSNVAQQPIQPVPSPTVQQTVSQRYITAQVYRQNPALYSSSKRVYFFHASWCPTCKSIDGEITADPSRIPQDVVIIKADFDTETELRKKYAVNSQYTFVQIDIADQAVKKYLATSYDKVLAGIQ